MGPQIVLSLFLSAVLVLAFPVGAQRAVSRTVRQCLQAVSAGDQASVTKCVRKLRLVRWFGVGSFDQMAWAYGTEQDSAIRSRTAEAYKEITGRDVAERFGILRD